MVRKANPVPCEAWQHLCEPPRCSPRTLAMTCMPYGRATILMSPRGGSMRQYQRTQAAFRRLSTVPSRVAFMLELGEGLLMASGCQFRFPERDAFVAGIASGVEALYVASIRRMCGECGPGRVPADVFLLQAYGTSLLFL